MTKINDGGPAYPEIRFPDRGHGQVSHTGGMSLRDYFAAQSLAGLLSNGRGPTTPWVEDDHRSVARWSYEIADAMIAERNKEQ